MTSPEVTTSPELDPNERFINFVKKHTPNRRGENAEVGDYRLSNDDSQILQPDTMIFRSENIADEQGPIPDTAYSLSIGAGKTHDIYFIEHTDTNGLVFYMANNLVDPDQAVSILTRVLNVLEDLESDGKLVLETS